MWRGESNRPAEYGQGQKSRNYDDSCEPGIPWPTLACRYSVLREQLFWHREFPWSGSPV